MVTGATGFVGCTLCPLLTERGLHVIAGRRTPGPLPPGAAAARQLGELAQPPSAAALAKALTGVDSVVHLAGRAHVMRDHAIDPEQVFFATNAQATEHLALAAARASVRRLIFISSIKVNGESTDGRAAFRASDPPAPQDAYGRSKLAAEQTLRRISADTGLEVVIIRPPLLHGPGVKGNLPRLLRLIDLGLPLPFAAIDNRRSLLANTNLCDLIAHCLHHPAAAGETFLAADTEALSTPDLIRLLAAGLHKSARLVPLPPAMLHGMATLTGQQAAIQRLTGSLLIDSRATDQRLGWTPGMTSEISLHQTAAAWASSLKKS
nr:NAD-dependent epimerase/dehydratase family protein [Rhabdochromatium marinum]